MQDLFVPTPYSKSNRSYLIFKISPGRILTFFSLGHTTVKVENPSPRGLISMILSPISFRLRNTNADMAAAASNTIITMISFPYIINSTNAGISHNQPHGL